MNNEPATFRDRVRNAAEAALKIEGAVGPLELFQHMRFLQSFHVEAWRKGNEHYRVLEPWVQVGPEKFQQTIRHFHEWVAERGLVSMDAPYVGRTLGGARNLQVTTDGDPEREKFYRTRYAPANLPARKEKLLKQKLEKAPDLVVFEKVGDDGECSECGTELPKGCFLLMEQNKPLCLACADMDHLLFLPRGDTALSRRSRKHSQLAAVVVRFSRSRKRYERQGLLVTAEALKKAEQECVADAPDREARREAAAVYRQEEDREFMKAVTEALLQLYPACPPAEARAIAEHACVRGSGRVGRSAAARELDPNALDLAVRAHVRHRHTNYDELLMRGTARLTAREMVRPDIARVLADWSAG